MRYLPLAAALCVLLPSLACCTPLPLVLPHPQKLQATGGTVSLVAGGAAEAVIVAAPGGGSAAFAAKCLAEAIRTGCGVDVPVVPAPPSTGTAIVFQAPGGPTSQRLAAAEHFGFERTPAPEQAYGVVTRGTQVQVLARSGVGLVYAAYTLAQLLEASPGQCRLPAVRIFDYPAAPVRGLLWLRGSDAYRHGYSQWAASFKLNAYTWYIDWKTPLSPAYRDILKDCADRGMALIPCISWFQNHDLRYSKAEYREPQLQRVREALDAGARAFGFNFDDNPLRLFGEDEAAYPSLVAAQADLLRRAHALTDPAGAALYFCPTIYWKPYPGAQGNDLRQQYDYVRGMGTLFPPGVRKFTTSLDAAWAKEEAALTGHRPVFWHNFFPNDMCDWKLYFEPYPRLPRELVSCSDGVFVLGGWQVDWWKVNYLTFACNTWNPTQPCTLREAFERLFPAEADDLTRFAVLLGGHEQPATTIGGYPNHPHTALRTTAFFNQEPTEANLKSLRQRLQNAEEAQRLAEGIAARGRVPATQARELLAAARRMACDYRMALTAAEVRRLEQAGERNRLAAPETLAQVDRALADGDQLAKVLQEVGWPSSAASDLALKSYFSSLRERLRSGQGAVPRLTAVRCKQPPTLDGRLEEPVWREAPSSTPYYVIEGDPRPAGQRTEARLLFDDRTLYLGFVCHEDQMAKLKTSLTRHDDSVWEDDCLEIFLDPGRTRRDYDHFIVNATGVQFEERVRNSKKDVAWNEAWQAATQREADRWTAEVAIPLATIGAPPPTPTLRMGINLTREEVPHREVSAWALTFGDFHQPGMFGDLAFGKTENVVWVEAESVARTNFLYGVQLATARPEARGTSGTGYLNLNVAHPGGPPGDPPDGSPCWYARWLVECPREGDYTLWVLGSGPWGAATWQWDEGPEEPAQRLAEAPVAPTYARPLQIGTWSRFGGTAPTVHLERGAHTLALRVKASDPATSKRCGYFLDALVIAPPDWRP